MPSDRELVQPLVSGRSVCVVLELERHGRPAVGFYEEMGGFAREGLEYVGV
jgi:hypothetical protein